MHHNPPLAHLEQEVGVAGLHRKLSMPSFLLIPPVKGSGLVEEGVESLKDGGYDLSDDNASCVVNIGVSRAIHLETQQQDLHRRWEEEGRRGEGR